MVGRVYRLVMMVVLFSGVALMAGCDGSPTGSGAPASLVSNAPTLPRATITIVRGQDLFTPFILVVRPGTRITWINDDTAAHNIVTSSSDQTFVNPQAFKLHAPPGRAVSFSLTMPGMYDYFDPLRVRWNTVDHRVAAQKGVPNYPLAMEGIIWVQGPLSGLAAREINPIPGKDLFAQDVLAVSKGGKVTWHNLDTDDHMVALVPGWEKPINPARLEPIQVKGRAEAFGGGAATWTFSTPGLYYYYCPDHADVNGRWHRAQAHTDASEAPIAMEGFVLVTDSPA